MLARLAELRAGGRIRAVGGVLVKAPTPGQDRRIDLPTIGPQTIEGAARAGLVGVAVDRRQHDRRRARTDRGAGRPMPNASSSACATRRPSDDRAGAARPAGGNAEGLSGRRRRIRRPARRRPDAGAPATRWREGELCRRRRARHGRRRSREPLSDRRSSRSSGSRRSRAASRISCGACARPCEPSWRRGRTCSSSSTVRPSPARSRGGCALGDPTIPIVEYVSPSVWAWRPGRARRMRSYIDHILALLPFEPEVHERLGGPPCTYVGHPLAERVADLRPNPAEAERRQAAPPVLLVLPGSRSGEIRRLLDVFADTVARVTRRIGTIEVIVPTVPHLLDPIRAATERWPVRPRIVVETADKEAAFRIARAALAKSGTVTLGACARRRSDGRGLQGLAARVPCIRAAASRSGCPRSSSPIWCSARTSCRNSCSTTAPRAARRCACCRCLPIARNDGVRSRRSPGSMRSWKSDRGVPAARAADIVLDVALGECSGHPCGRPVRGAVSGAHEGHPYFRREIGT